MKFQTDAAYLENYMIVVSPAINGTSAMCGSESLNVTVSMVSWTRLMIHRPFVYDV